MIMDVRRPISGAGTRWLRSCAMRRRRREPGVLSMLVCRGKLVISAAPALLEWSRTGLAPHCSVEWSLRRNIDSH